MFQSPYLEDTNFALQRNELLLLNSVVTYENRFSCLSYEH